MTVSPTSARAKKSRRSSSRSTIRSMPQTCWSIGRFATAAATTSPSSSSTSFPDEKPTTTAGEPAVLSAACRRGARPTAPRLAGSQLTAQLQEFSVRRVPRFPQRACRAGDLARPAASTRLPRPALVVDSGIVTPRVALFLLLFVAVLGGAARLHDLVQQRVVLRRHLQRQGRDLRGATGRPVVVQAARDRTDEPGSTS